MARRYWFALALLAICAFDASLVLAQDPAAGGAAAPAAAPAVGLWPPAPAVPFTRDGGYYLSFWKIAAVWLLFALWVSTSDWVSQDCLAHKLNYTLWNSVVVFSFFLALILHWILPWFWAGYPLLWVAYLAPLITYIVIRNRRVNPQDIVLNRPHLRRWFAEKINAIGMSMESETKSAHELGPEIQLKAHGGATERDDNVNLLTARQSPGFVTAKELIDDAIQRRADSIMMDYGAQAVMVRYQIDGFWHNSEPQDREKADPALAVLKTLAALNPNERRARQMGTIPIEAKKKKYTLKLVSQGAQSGERVLFQLEEKKPPFDTFDDIGMRQKMAEQLRELLAQRSGFFLVCSVPAGGLTTTYNVVLSDTDRFIRNFVGVEDLHKPERELENVPVTTYDSAAGETPATVLPKLIRTYPDVIAVRNLVDAETVQIMCEQVKENRVVIGSVRAKEAVEALLRVLMLKVPPEEFAEAITAVVNVRLVRKLCDACKEAYKPPVEVLRQLGLPAGRIEAFYRPPTAPPESEKDICQECLGLGYKGRTGIFELLVVDDAMRQVLASTPKIELLREVARKSRHRNLQEEGVLLVARGATSLPEVMRVLKG